MKGNTASMIALIVAGLVLLVVGGNSYSKYLRAQYEKEYGVLAENQRPAPGSQANPAVGGNALVQPSGLDSVASTLDPKGSIPAAAMSRGAPLPAQNSTGQQQVQSSRPAYRTEHLPAATAPSPGSQVPAVDPEIAQLQARLRAAEQEIYQQKVNQTRGAAAIAAAESGTLREVMSQPGAAGANGASSALFPQNGAAGAAADVKSVFEKQILNASVAGKVVAFNPDWGFVQIDAGKNSNISKDTKFAVRRGTSIVGYVKVTEVNDKTAIAELTSRNEFSETARKPKPGDDVIVWSFFEEASR